MHIISRQSSLEMQTIISLSGIISELEREAILSISENCIDGWERIGLVEELCRDMINSKWGRNVAVDCLNRCRHIIRALNRQEK